MNVYFCPTTNGSADRHTTLHRGVPVGDFAYGRSGYPAPSWVGRFYPLRVNAVQAGNDMQ